MDITPRVSTVMNLTHEVYGDALIATITGPINSKTAPLMEAELRDPLERVAQAVFDMTDVDDVSSSGVRLLLRAYHVTATKNGRTALVGLPQSIQETMKEAGLLDFFIVCDTLDEALSAISRDSSRLRLHRG